MARRNRVGLSLNSEVNDVLQELAIMTNTTKTALIGGILSDMLPPLKKTLKALRLAQIGKESAAVGVMQDLLGGIGEKLDTATLDMFEMKKKVDADGK